MRANNERSKRKLVLVIIAIIAFFAFTAIAQVWTHFNVIEYGYRIAKAQRLHRKLHERNRRLNVEMTLLKSPTRLKKIAIEDFGLREVDPEQVFRIRNKKIRVVKKKKMNLDKSAIGMR